jgi:5'-deoxynucleotidase YfbR-like HD superfamily hydrolase
LDIDWVDGTEPLDIEGLVTDEETKGILKLGRLVLKFGQVERATFHEDGCTPESDTTHTVMLGLIACQLAEVINQRESYDIFDVNRVAMLALVHDLVEAESGDTQTFGITAAGQEAKKKREQEAFGRLIDTLGAESFIVKMINFYEEQVVIEAQFVRYLDKAMPKITHILNGSTTLHAMDKTKDNVIEEHAKQRAKLAAEYPDIARFVDPILAELMRLTHETGWVGGVP